MEESFDNEKFPGIQIREDLARELNIGEDRIQVRWLLIRIYNLKFFIDHYSLEEREDEIDRLNLNLKLLSRKNFESRKPWFGNGRAPQVDFSVSVDVSFETLREYFWRVAYQWKTLFKLCFIIAPFIRRASLERTQSSVRSVNYTNSPYWFPYVHVYVSPENLVLHPNRVEDFLSSRHLSAWHCIDRYSAVCILFCLSILTPWTFTVRSGSKTVAQDGANMRSRTNQHRSSLLQRRCQTTVTSSHQPCSSRLLPFCHHWAKGISDRGTQPTLRFLRVLLGFRPVVRLDRQFSTGVLISRVPLHKLLVWWAVRVYLLQQALRSVPVPRLLPALWLSTKLPVNRTVERVATL